MVYLTVSLEGLHQRTARELVACLLWLVETDQWERHHYSKAASQTPFNAFKKSNTHLVSLNNTMNDWDIFPWDRVDDDIAYNIRCITRIDQEY